MPPQKRKNPGLSLVLWPEPEPVDLRINRVVEFPTSEPFPVNFKANGMEYAIPPFPGECLVGFKVDGKEYLGYFQPKYVSREKMVLSAAIHGDTDEGWFVRIPDETFQGGPQIIIPEHEKDTLIIRHKKHIKIGVYQIIDLIDYLDKCPNEDESEQVSLKTVLNAYWKLADDDEVSLESELGVTPQTARQCLKVLNAVGLLRRPE